MDFALGLFAVLISGMFVATFASSIIVASREARDDQESRRLSVF
ncbi:hypothetical protein [Rhizobium alvei]|jgi:hypothetical protein|uniref:Uncharacterized protein n=1 Tax=Rhizobium alvei TaxID=1132659 RepID=A0ABT8YGH6_9HYPH|nr:hypothetical protein [Rhizobium alvei]MDO6962757.1 hypothetical protein [Rhizobium alvei]